MPLSGDAISDRDFRTLTALLGAECGIAVTPAKRTMLETRLRRRARVLGMRSLAAYCAHVQTKEGRRNEWGNLVDAVTTHKTDFFREPSHFDYLITHALPELARIDGAGTGRPMQVWSAACSTGEEPYTFAMVLGSYAEQLAPQAFRFRIWASDVSAAVIDIAARAVYPEAAIAPAPHSLRRRYVLRSRDRGRGLIRMAPEIRGAVDFRQLNLMAEDYGFAEPLDIVMCRNVMIYFDRATQERVARRITRTLHCGGYLFIGHSESLNGMDLPLEPVAPAVYRRVDG
jgi:chemotaxis protein methyltransferase CheR